MKRLLPLLLMVVLLLGAAFFPAGQTRAQGETLVRISPALVTLQPGQSTTIAVEVVAVTDLRGFEVTIEFDPSRVYILPESLDIGEFLTPGLLSPDEKVDNDAGTLVFGNVIIGDEVSSGSGALFTFTVQAKQRSGNAPLEILRSELVGGDYFMIPHSVEHGLVKIISDQEPGFQVFLPLILR
jgi:hypothetical protein